MATLAPSIIDAGVGLHLVIEEHHDHDAEQRHDTVPPPGAVHGHAHGEGTPEHDHGSSLPEPSKRAPQSVTTTCANGTAVVSLPLGAASGDPPASVAPSPPTVSTAILRI